MPHIQYTKELRTCLSQDPAADHTRFIKKILISVFLTGNALLTTALWNGYSLDDLKQLAPKAYAMGISGTSAGHYLKKHQQIAAFYQQDSADLQHLFKHYEPSVQVQKRLVAYISKQYSIASSAATEIIKNTFAVSKKYQIDPLLMLAIIAQESRFNPIAQSSVGALGLTQALPKAHPEKIQVIENNSGDILSVSDNVELGAKIFSEYSRRFKGNTMLALQQYNGNLADKEQRYAKKVIAHYERFKKSSQEYF